MSRKLILISCSERTRSESVCVCSIVYRRRVLIPSVDPYCPPAAKLDQLSSREQDAPSDPMSLLPTTQQQRLATLRAPACQRYYATRLAAESPHPSTFDVPRRIFRPSTTGTKMLVKRAWTLEDVADPDTFELVRHPSREPFTLPVWVRHGPRTSRPLRVGRSESLQHELTHARPLCADPHGATVCQSIRRPACGVARACGVEVWHHHAQRSAVSPHVGAAG